MADKTESLRKQTINVLEEVFEGEAVIINIASGFYYSLNPAATEIWQLFAEPRDSGALTGQLSDEQLSLVDQLKTNELLVTTEEPAVALSAAVQETGPPKLERFDEMADLLQFDPVHDIDLDGDGWPVVREGFTRPTSA